MSSKKQSMSGSDYVFILILFCSILLSSFFKKNNNGNLSIPLRPLNSFPQTLPLFTPLFIVHPSLPVTCLYAQSYHTGVRFLSQHLFFPCFHIYSVASYKRGLSSYSCCFCIILGSTFLNQCSQWIQFNRDDTSVLN